MIEPFLADDRFIADVAESLRRPSQLDVWWLGQSGFLLHHRERPLLVDPYLSDSLTAKYASTDKPHTRLSRRVVDPAQLGRQLGHLIAITSSHGHTDHLDPDTLRPFLNAARPHAFLAPKAVLQLAWERTAAAGLEHPPQFEGMDEGSVWNLGNQLKVTGVAAAHEAVERDEKGHCKYLGYVFEFARHERSSSGSIWRTDHEWTVYHAGDTVLYDGLVERLRPLNIDVALLPINGCAPGRRVAGNLNGREAAWLAKEIGARLVIPCHYDMFEFNTADPNDEFIPECERLGQPYRVLRLGERFSSSEIP